MPQNSLVRPKGQKVNRPLLPIQTICPFLSSSQQRKTIKSQKVPFLLLLQFEETVFQPVEVRGEKNPNVEDTKG